MQTIRVFDGHCDTAVRLYRQKENLQSNCGHIALERLENPAGYAQFFAFCTCDEHADEPEELFENAYSYFLRQLRAHDARIVLCTNAQQAQTAFACGKSAAFLSIEGAEAISCDIAKLDKAQEMGVRMIALTWNHANALAGSCLTGEGLSEQGKNFVRRAQELGMIVDVSHLSERAFWDICEIAQKPIIASHSCCKALCNHPRNLTDEQCRAIFSLGGTVGINFYEPFLTDGRANLDTVWAHAEHLLSLGGEGHIALGADFDGCERLPRGISGVQDFGRLAAHFLKKGCSEEQLQDMFFDSLWEVLTICTM